MRALRPILAALSLLTIVLSGCTSDPEPASVDATVAPVETETTGPAAGPSADPAAPTTSAGPAPVKNVLPKATLKADNLTGEAPMDVTFTIEASDEDGDALSWTLDVDGDQIPDAEGDTVPASYTHTYTDGFTGNASLVVSDGTEEVASAVMLDIAAPPVAETFTFECAVPLPSLVLSVTGLIGSCALGTLDAESLFFEESVPDSCAVMYTDGDTGGVGNLVRASLGTVYPAGTSFSATCQPPALPNSVVSATFEVVA